MAIFAVKDPNAVMTEEELKKVNGGQLYTRDGIYIRSDDPGLAGKVYEVMIFGGTGAADFVISRARGASDAEKIQMLLDNGYIAEVADVPRWSLEQQLQDDITFEGEMVLVYGRDVG